MERFFVTGEVAQLGGVTSDAVRGWERRGLLRAIKTPTGRRLFRERDVLRFLATRTGHLSEREGEFAKV